MITRQCKLAKLGGREGGKEFSEAYRDRMSDIDMGCNTGNSSEVLGNQFSQWNSQALEQGPSQVVECSPLEIIKTGLDEALGNLL